MADSTFTPMKEDKSLEERQTEQLTQEALGIIKDATANPVGFLQTLRQLQAQNRDMMAQIQTLQEANKNSTQPKEFSIPSSTQSDTPVAFESSAPVMPPIDSQLIATIAAAVAATLPRSLDPRPSKTEKLPDIAEYDGDMDKLDAWEQALVQRMYGNRDRYPTEEEKITYAESRLTIGKKAHNLMNQHRVKGICTLATFAEWRTKLREACGNRFEEEDAREYLRDTLKQDKLSFDEYYNLFSQKVEQSGLEDISLIEAMKKNVRYDLRTNSINYRKEDGAKPVTFAEHVAMFQGIDWELRHIKYTHPRTHTTTSSTTTTPSTANSANRKNNTNSSSPPTRPPTKPTTLVVAPVATTPVVSTTTLPPGDPMDLSSAMAMVSGQSLQVPGIREICNKWRLCYYCKKQHPGKTAIDCPNKKWKTTDIRSLVVYDEAEAKANSENA